MSSRLAFLRWEQSSSDIELTGDVRYRNSKNAHPMSELGWSNHRALTGAAGSRYRSDRPVSTSRAEGCVDEIANARISKRQQTRWSPRGAHRVALVRAAVLDGLGATSCEHIAA